VYGAHLRLAMQHPEMSEPMLGVINSPVEIVRYKQFVASLLSTAEEVLQLDPSAQWRAMLARQLVPHRSYLASEDFQRGALADCTNELKSLIQHVTGS
jgi:hypothetical protein